MPSTVVTRRYRHVRNIVTLATLYANDLAPEIPVATNYLATGKIDA